MPSPIQFSHSNPTISVFHGWSFWVLATGESFGNKLLQFEAISGKQQSYVQFDNDTTFNYSGLGTVAIDTVFGEEWHHFWVFRQAATISVYQNNSLKGSFSISGGLIFGGGDLIIDADEELFDVRFYAPTTGAVKSIEAISSYYNDVINNQGKIYLP